jgi:TetR/AcrR family transcriptional repressor of nem operon
MSSIMPRKNDKRDRLIDAANDLIYQQTFNATTLADIAAKANVPLGNVYYYFKTKDDILKAVIQKRSAELQAQFSAFEEAHPQAKDRLRAFIESNVETSETTAQYGCTLGSLCQELGKFTGELSNIAAELMHRTLEWVEAQFKTMGKGEQSTVLAKYLVGSLQGVSLLTLTFKDPSLLKRQSKTLEKWLEAA